MRINASSSEAKIANTLVKELQHYFVAKLNDITATFGNNQTSEAFEWLRDEGLHGGGIRFEMRDESIFNRGSVNVSQVHYDDDETKNLSSATAISCIIHPKNPHAPSMHMHFSWTQMRNGKGYWRLMADLNPSLLPDDVSKRTFDMMLNKAAGNKFIEEGLAQGERYFNIPILGRTRGISHFYLEDYNTGDFEKDKAYVEQFAIKVIDTYIGIVIQSLQYYVSYTQEETQIQLDYHTLYFFQVLTLDRGTTSGLLVHEQNDVGIMGSIPSHINRELLASWVEKMPKPQDELVTALLEALPNQIPTPIEETTKKKLANAVRKHYIKYPEALSMQASGNSVPPTVANHS